MKTRRLNNFLVVGVLLLVILCSVVGAFAINANALTTKFTFSSELDAQYKVNQVFNVPTATIGETEADFIIKLPDGTFSNKQSFTLKTPGNYTIEYSATVGGKTYRTSKTFVCTGNLFTLKGIGSSEYRTYEYENSSGARTASGEFFTLYNGDSIVYNDVIDLSKFSGATDTLYKMSPIVSTVGEQDIEQYQVTLTDAYDENVSVNIRFKKYNYASEWDTVLTVMDASFNGIYCGTALREYDWDGSTKDTNGAYYIDGMKGLYKYIYEDEAKTRPITVDRTDGHYTAFINHDKAGAGVSYSMTGGTIESPQNDGARWIGICYDVETNILYGTCKFGKNDTQITRTPIADFENADIFGEKFQGFTNNMVRIEIKPTIFNKGYCGFFIQEFAGQSISKESLDSFVPSCEPELNVDFGEYDENNIPNVRQGSDYKVFDATALDLIDGNIPVKTSVYYGYNNLNKIQIQMTDGVFTAKYAGDYTIVYQATNSFGKTVEKIITVKSVGNATPLGINIFGEPDYSVSVPAGKAFKALNSYEIINAFGNAKMTAKAVLSADESVCFDLNEDNNFTFVPVVSGEYKIVYLVKDYSSSTTVTRTLNVVASDNFYYVVKGAFPEYFIQNGRYDLNFVESYTLNTGKPVLANTTLSVDPQNGGALIPISGVMQILSNYVYNGSVKLVYNPDVQNVNSDTYFVKEIPVIDANLYTNSFNKSKYLVNTNGQFEFTSTDKGTECDVTSLQNGSAKFTFANYLNVNPFNIKMSALTSGDEFVAFDKLNVYIYDPLNLKNYIVASLFKSDDGWYVSVNDGNVLKLSNTWGGADDEFYVNYSADKGKLIINNYFQYTDVKFFGTDIVAEFTCGAKLEVEIIGSDGCDGIVIESINDVVVDKYGDYSESKIDFTKDKNAGEREINEVITLLPFKAYDVFAPYMDVTVQVMFAKTGSVEKDFVNSIDGVRLVGCDASKSYQFKLLDYGTYSIQVSSKDPNNSDNNVFWDYSIIVVDYSKPTVEITENKVTEFEVGEEFVVPGFNFDSARYDWIVVLKLPNSHLVSVTEDINYTFNHAGSYQVTLIVYDANYNMSEISYNITVK